MRLVPWSLAAARVWWPHPYLRDHVVAQALDAHPETFDLEFGAGLGQGFVVVHQQAAERARIIGRQVPVEAAVQAVHRNAAIDQQRAVRFMVDMAGIVARSEEHTSELQSLM